MSVAAIAGGAVGTALGGPGGAAIGAEIGQEVSTGFGLFHTSAAGPNADAAKAVYPLAEAGDLTAVQCIITRTGLNTQTSKAPWVDALNQLKQTQPDYITQAGKIDFGFGPGGNAWQRFGAIAPQDCVTAVTGANAIYAKPPALTTGGVSPGSTGAATLLSTLSGGALSGANALVIVVVLVLAYLFFRKG